MFNTIQHIVVLSLCEQALKQCMQVKPEEPLLKSSERLLPVYVRCFLQRVVYAAGEGAKAAADQCADAGAASREGRNARTGQRAAGSAEQGVFLGA